jgi:glycosyltransferase involved in cell wall biosynthesis
MQNNYPGKNVFFAPIALINFGKSDFILPKDQVVFLFFGYIRDYKRVDILINAANKVFEKTGNKFKVRIFGFCSDWEKYEGLIKYPEIFELRIESIPNEDIPRLFEEAHYFVMPYQDLAQSATLTVAFNYNLPVIASDIDSLKEFIIDGKNGFLFEKGSIESLASVMMSLMDIDEKGYMKIRKNLAEYVEKNYSTESIVKLYVDYFESINK